MVRLVTDVSTLLGPERTTRVVVFQSLEMPRVDCVPGGVRRQAWPGLAYRRRLAGSLVWGLGVVGWLFVENCTVDASIFVVKLSRANGGCLGTRSR